MLACKDVSSGSRVKTGQPVPIDTMEFNMNGLNVEVEGVDREDLPAAFDFGEVMQVYDDGGDVEDATKHVHRQVWRKSHRPTLFWDAWIDRSA
ncbi:hypothetical protein HVTV-2_gp17 [Haloarcula virus HVTV-2]|uniref:Uncharacterized protein n=1 Tax=Haloarcula vallismortis tailed virus 1 TaxID=1262528 RepID=L7TNF6_9CAUD|nr:hypothetical protein HVTV1_17 [Haloarcula vallismortis tailed virus 1]AGC34387.1 hypothetical protein HVTV1_17 [Haloarcula vallismortis tailed virus 1]UBF22824.1 hypothetical protein HVTV-2_gp17 [Haloarcula virus HVTV-2]